MASAIRSSFSLKMKQKPTDICHIAAKVRSRIITEFEPPGIIKCIFKHDVYNMTNVLSGQSVRVWTDGKFTPSRGVSTLLKKKNILVKTWHWAVKHSSCSYTISKDRKTIECFGHESLGGCEAIGIEKWTEGIHRWTIKLTTSRLTEGGAFGIAYIGVISHRNSISNSPTATPSIQSIPPSLPGISTFGNSAEGNPGFNEQETYGISLDGDILYKPMESMKHLDEPVIVHGKKATAFLELDCTTKTLKVRVESQTSSSMKIQNHGWHLPENVSFQPWIFIGTANCTASIL
mmetsp:Transcript_31014/g.43166  ORF Transcript_31014/g.43166 Transcript_31014/m.43166 type:complete len:290 (+) Transcript_31014:528-1397(+)